MRTIRVIRENGSEIVWQEGKLSGDEYLVNYLLAKNEIATEEGGTTVYNFFWVDPPCIKHDAVMLMWAHGAFYAKKEKVVKIERTPTADDPSWTRYQVDFGDMIT